MIERANQDLMPTHPSNSDEIKSLIKKYTTSIPVILTTIADDYHIQLHAMFMAKDSGRIRNRDGQYIIDYNIFHPPTIQRFTIAHELGHYFLHRDRIDQSSEGLTDNAIYRSGLSTKEEIEANTFAADLLMPLDIVCEVIDTHNKEEEGALTPSLLAEKFHVFELAMKVRLGIPTYA